jgi:hypothetical protein
MGVTRNARFLMANLGSEVSRLLDWKSKGDREAAGKCFKRAQGILDQLMLYPEMLCRAAEIEILQKVLVDLFEEHRQYSVSSEELKGYFLPFSMSVARGFDSSAA